MGSRAIAINQSGAWTMSDGTHMTSLVAEIGAVVENHLRRIGMIVDEELTPEQQKLMAEKRAATEGKSDTGDYPESATLCNKCNTKAMVMMDGCETCLSCGYSKCG